MDLQTAIDLDATTNERVVLRRRPEGLLSKDDVELEDGVALPELADGEALIEVGSLGVDATVRTWLSKAEGYLPAVEIGETARASGIGRVVATRCETFPLGRLRLRAAGVAALRRRPGRPARHAPGQRGGRPRHAVRLRSHRADRLRRGRRRRQGGGRADGGRAPAHLLRATGSLAAQIAKIRGCRVIGICGSADKARWLVDDLGLDGVINHRVDDVRARLVEAPPHPVDVYFDNVGGPILDAVLDRLAMHARVVLCGAIAIYNEHGRPPGPSNYFQLINRRARMEGSPCPSITGTASARWRTLGTWMAEGKLQYRTEQYDGLGSAVDALNALFTGANTGKTVIRL